MNNWGIIKKFAEWIGTVFAIFTLIAAIINYELNLMYNPAPPMSYFLISLMTAILPYLLGAVVLFLVAALSSQQDKLAVEKEMETEKTSTKSADTDPNPEDATK